MPKAMSPGVLNPVRKFADIFVRYYEIVLHCEVIEHPYQHIEVCSTQCSFLEVPPATFLARIEPHQLDAIGLDIHAKLTVPHLMDHIKAEAGQLMCHLSLQL
jgi:hypothetical protein